MEGTKRLPYIRFRKVKNLAVDSFAFWVHAVAISLQIPGEGECLAGKVFTYIWLY